jgi:hypothetical protein
MMAEKRWESYEQIEGQRESSDRSGETAVNGSDGHSQTDRDVAKSRKDLLSDGLTD